MNLRQKVQQTLLKAKKMYNYQVRMRALRKKANQLGFSKDVQDMIFAPTYSLGMESK